MGVWGREEVPARLKPSKLHLHPTVAITPMTQFHCSDTNLCIHSQATKNPGIPIWLGVEKSGVFSE